MNQTEAREVVILTEVQRDEEGDFMTVWGMPAELVPELEEAGFEFGYEDTNHLDMAREFLRFRTRSENMGKFFPIAEIDNGRVAEIPPDEPGFVVTGMMAIVFEEK